jgi:hypothetical protein
MKESKKIHKNAASENPHETQEAIAYLITIFAGLYAAIWIGNALGLC